MLWSLPLKIQNLLSQMFRSFIYSVLSHRFNKIGIIMRNKNLIFFVQPNEASFTAPERLMKTYMNRFTITEDDQVSILCLPPQNEKLCISKCRMI